MAVIVSRPGQKRHQNGVKSWHGLKASQIGFGLSTTVRFTLFNSSNDPNEFSGAEGDEYALSYAKLIGFACLWGQIVKDAMQWCGYCDLYIVY